MSSKSNKLVVERVNASSSVSFSGNASKTISISVGKSGYTPLGIVGFGSNGYGGSLHVGFAQLSGTTVTLNLRNLISSTLTDKPWVRVLYVKS